MVSEEYGIHRRFRCVGTILINKSLYKDPTYEYLLNTDLISEDLFYRNYSALLPEAIICRLALSNAKHHRHFLRSPNSYH